MLHQIHRSVSDFNGDGLVDIFHHTQNYHGRDGYQCQIFILMVVLLTHARVNYLSIQVMAFKEYEIVDTFQYED